MATVTATARDPFGLRASLSARIDVLMPSPPQTRNPFLWSFEERDPFNHPAGTGAVYVNPPWFQAFLHVYFDVGVWANRIYQASPSDPIRNVQVTSSGHDPKINPDPDASNFCAPLSVPTTLQIRIPDGAVPSGPEWYSSVAGGYWPDAHMMLVDTDGVYHWEFYHMRHYPQGSMDWRCDNIFRNMTKRMGHPARTGAWPNCHHGGRASGAVNSGGMIRGGELASGRIRHALAGAFGSNLINRDPPGPYTFVWPATASDPPSGYTGTGQFYMGSLLVIPYTVNLSTQGFETAAGLTIARAMQEYGLYNVDGTTSANTVILGCTQEAEAEIAALQAGATWNNPNAFSRDLRRAFQLAKVVSNNSPTSIGGGGTPIAPFAPAFA